MAGTLKPVKFKLAWQHYRVGDVITPNATLRDWLIGNGFADLADAAAPNTPKRPLIQRVKGVMTRAAGA